MLRAALDQRLRYCSNLDTLNHLIWTADLSPKLEYHLNAFCQFVAKGQLIPYLFQQGSQQIGLLLVLPSLEPDCLEFFV